MEQQKTSLYDQHIKLNAKIVPFAGWSMPVQYTSVKTEVEAVRKHCGIFDVSHMGEFFVVGEDASKFVDYLLPNEFLSVPPGKAVYSPLCNNEGGIVDDLIAYKIAQNKILICVNAANIEKDWNWIKKHHENFRCDLTNKSSEYSLIAIQGPDSVKFLEPLFGNSFASMDYYSVKEFSLKERSVILSRTGYTGEDGFELFIPNELATELWQGFVKQGATPCGLAARDLLRLEVCYPLYGKELSDDHNPYECNLAWTVKDKAQDFVGKKALAQKLKKSTLVKFTMQGAIPREGYKILAEQKEAGIVTSGSISPELNKGIGIARIGIEHAKNDQLQIEIRNKLYDIEIQKKPFITGGAKK